LSGAGGGRGEEMSRSPRGPGTVSPVKYVQNYDQVARGKLRVQAVALAPDSQPSSLLSARRNPNLERARFLQFSPAVAFQARRGRNPRAVSPAHLAEDPSLKEDLLVSTLNGGASWDLEIEAQVIPPRLHRAIKINAEKLAQDFFKSTGSGSLQSRMSRLAAAASLWPGIGAAGFVVCASSGRINEVFVGLKRFAETVRCEGIVGVAVGMPAEGQQPEGPFDFIFACANRYAQNFVIAGCHKYLLEKHRSASVATISRGNVPGDRCQRPVSKPIEARRPFSALSSGDLAYSSPSRYCIGCRLTKQDYGWGRPLCFYIQERCYLQLFTIHNFHSSLDCHTDCWH
jgi:hypothetical protein